MRIFVTLFTVITLVTAFGCKTKKGAAVPESPYTDTFKMVVPYQTDSLKVLVRKIIINDSLYSGVDETVDYSILDVQQKDSILFITLSSFINCEKSDFLLYQSSVVLKTYPPRIRCRIAKGKMKDCTEKPAIYTIAFDIRPILKDYPEANIMFSGSQKYATVKRY